MKLVSISIIIKLLKISIRTKNHQTSSMSSIWWITSSRELKLNLSPLSRMFKAWSLFQAWEWLLTKKQEILSKRPKTSWKGSKMHKFWPKKQGCLLFPENSHAWLFNIIIVVYAFMFSLFSRYKFKLACLLVFLCSFIISQRSSSFAKVPRSQDW